MTTFTQLFTIVGMVFLTYVMFQAFGAPRKTLLYTKKEKQEWDVLITKPIGSWFTITNIVGSLTSLATCYIFFIGSSQFFGWAIFACSATILFSARITNFFTRHVLEQEYYAKLLDSHEQTGGVIASVFWRDNDRAAQLTAISAKWVSLVNIASIIWLEFAFFGNVAGDLIQRPDLITKSVLVIFCCFTVTYFTLRFGLRGIVFADAFQSPILAFAGVILVIGSVILFAQSPLQIGTMLKPMLPGKQVFLFLVQLTFLNLFINLVTESHWLRLWVFREKEITRQESGVKWTAALWALLAVLGFFAYSLSGGKTGMEAVGGFLSRLGGVSILFLAAFWIGAMAALFSSADTQIYSFLVVKHFNAKTGTLDNPSMASMRPMNLAAVTTVVFVLCFLGVKYSRIDFDQLVFLIFPISLNILPAFVRVVLKKTQSPKYLWVSVVLYALFAVISAIRPPTEFWWRLCPPLMPMLVSTIAWLKK